ncbi:protein NETWORKED 2A [Coffea arabica]|uniref:Protein NETWORKED 2A n=1 Tax=Coffea arabica TaxID=13443 RepID=A0ABM4VY44_COFAR
MLHRAARNAYSWWWASHVRTKQSKWLDQNLQDMEEKVEYVLKIIEEEADTFKQRAEMYYRKRPELVNFVEDSVRRYRALAERYDHLSRELQNANKTIASVFPETVDLPMDDDDFDGQNLPVAAMPLDKFNILSNSKHPPPAPEMSIAKNSSVRKRNGKMPTRLMSRKGLLKTNADDSAAAGPISGLNKSEAFQKIDKIQKEILALQTEKEFVKSSYESGLEKYWNIENQISGMQTEVSNLQDEFGICKVIDDNEARTLMTATALKSCQQALTQLQEKQEKSAEEARGENRKLQETREKFKRLKEKFNSNQAHQEVYLEEESRTSHNVGAYKQDKEVDNAEQNIIHDVEPLQKRIKEESQLNLASPLTMSELAEKVDELVDQIINLESAVFSQTAYVKRLTSETNELQTHLRSLEEEKDTLIEGSDGMNRKIRDLEEELQRVQRLNKCIQEKNHHLQDHCVEASCNLDDLSEKLLHVKLDEETEKLTLFSKDTHVPGVNPAKDILRNKKHAQNAEENFHVVNIQAEKQASKPEQNRCKIKEINCPVQSSSSNHHDCILPYREVKSTTDASAGLEVQEIPSCSSVVLQCKVESDGIKGDSNSTSAESNSCLLSNQSQNQFTSLSGASLDVNSEEWFGEARDGIGPDYGSTIMKNRVKFNLVDTSTSETARDESFFQLNQQPNSDDFPTAQKVASPGANSQKKCSQDESVSPPDYHIKPLENVTMEEKVLKKDVLVHSSSSICGKGIMYSNQGDHLCDKPIKGPMKDVHSDSSERRSAEEGRGTATYQSLSIEGHMKVESSLDDFFLSNRDDCMDGYSLKDQVGDLLDANLDKSDNNNNIQSAAKNHPRSFKIETGGDLSTPSASDNNRDMEEDYWNTAKASRNSGESRLSSQLNDLPMNSQVKSISDTSPLKVLAANEDNRAPDISPTSSELATVKDQKMYSFLDQGKDQEAKQQQVFQPLQHDLSGNQDELGVGDDDQPNWKELFLSGLDDREKLLLQEYTSILRNYKEAKKKLNEVEKKKRASLFQYCIQIKVLKSANASKDAKIESLEKKLNLLGKKKDAAVDSIESRASASYHVSAEQNLLTEQKALADMVGAPTPQSMDTSVESPPQEQPKISFVEENGAIKVINLDETQNLSVVEERIRTDIDELLEENIGFWMKFSTSFHQVQKFRTTVRDLQAELAEVKANNKHSGSTNHQLLVSEIRPIYRHLSEIQTELTLWLDQNDMLKDDLDNRLASLSGIQEEITRLSNAGSSAEETELSDYQAAKFQGEVLNMKQENNKLAGELHFGLERVKVILVEIERTLRDLDTEFGVAARKQQPRNSPIRSKIPLRTFLFGVKLKKQKPSFFACISPSLQKQYSDLKAVQI